MKVELLGQLPFPERLSVALRRLADLVDEGACLTDRVVASFGDYPGPTTVELRLRLFSNAVGTTHARDLVNALCNKDDPT